jgi:antitoxin (DNA-binding transcriptional repressor) of toxin-antitoxin stability system
LICDEFARGHPVEETISVTNFKARCLDILKRLGQRKLDKVTVTRHGTVVAVITPPPSTTGSIRSLHGFMKGSVLIPEGMDLTDSTLDEEELDAARGILHR